jgi:ribonuclease D
MPRQDRPTFPPPALITDTASLAALCERLGHEKVVTVDTEFMRERTYWPELCVVQLGSPTDTAVVDALAPGLDLAPLGALLAKPDVTKVFHAARQDVEIFVLKFGTVPTPLVDTQIAAMVAGFGDQVGYDTLVGSLTGGQIDKSHRFSDWSVRPLSQAQITYAAADVTHLRVVYDKLTERLSREGRLDWVGEEMATLTDPATYRADPERMWERLRARTNNRRVLGMLRAIAAWREREAQRANIPRGRMLKDESLLELAAVAPTDAEGLARVRGISKGFAEGKQGASLLAAMAEARALPEDQLPIPAAERNGPRPSPALVSLLKVLLAASCEAHDVAPRLVASSDDLDRIAAGETDVPALHGWRQRIFGDQAQALRDGKLALGVAGKRIKTIPL